jgi:hypothetical protein
VSIGARAEGPASTGLRIQSSSRHYPNDANLHRHGKCLSHLADGQWGVCNKDMHENSYVVFKVCDWETWRRYVPESWGSVPNS